VIGPLDGSPWVFKGFAGSYPFINYEEWLYRPDFIESMRKVKLCVDRPILGNLLGFFNANSQ